MVKRAFRAAVGRRPRKMLLAVALWLACLAGASAEGHVAASQQLLREATGAYQAGDYEAFKRALEAALELNPHSYYTRYNLACAYARTGQAERALDLLEQLTNARADFGMADDPDLESLLELPRFQALVARLKASTAPISNSRHRDTFDQLGLIPEGIAYDQATERLFFGSMRNGEVFVVDRYGQLAKFAAVEHQGKLAAIGMTVDDKRGLLWVIGSTFFMTEGHDPQAPVHSGVFGFDLGSGELREKYLGADVGNGYNDVTVGPAGDLYLSGAVIGIVPAGADAIVPVKTSNEVFGSNGIVATADGRHLITSSYPVGIAVIRLADGETHFLRAPENIPLYGIDGLYGYQGDLIAVQNGVRPWRLVRLKLEDDLSAVTGAVTIEFANAASTATTGVIVGNEIHFIGQGPEPEDPPAHFPKVLAGSAGKTVIMTAPLD